MKKKGAFRGAACPCGKPATKWDGDIYGTSRAPFGPPGPLYRCDDHDPHDKWFTITPEDYQGEEE